MTPQREEGLVQFAERVLSLVDEASYSTTYKHALLLGMIDSLRASTDRKGDPPQSLTVGTVAERVVGLYWPQTFPFPASDGPLVLRQSRTKEARLVRLITTYRESHGLPPRAPLSAASGLTGFPALVREVEWTLANMPLPRLQRPYEPFIYDIDWDETTPRQEYFGPGVRRIRFKSGASRNLVVLANLLRPLIERRWASLIAQMNRSVLEESLLDSFLFDPDRERPRRLLTRLSETQEGKCFYCAEPVGAAHIDHFLPWSQTGDDGLDNYVVAGGRCNLDKAAILPSAIHVERWAPRLKDADASERFQQLSDEAGWPRQPERTLGLARSLYLTSAGTKILWVEPGKHSLLRSERARIQSALS